MGDAELMNDYIFHNYSKAVSYFDDDLEKTALFLDQLSLADCVNHYIGRTQNYEMMEQQYLPAYTFKRFCSGYRADKNEFPREIKQMR